MSVNEYGFVCHLTSLVIACDCPMSQMLTPCDQAIIAKLLCPTHDRRWMDRDRSAMHRAFVSNCLHLLSFPLLPPHSPPGHGAPRSVRQLRNIFNLKHCSAHRPAAIADVSLVPRWSARPLLYLHSPSPAGRPSPPPSFSMASYGAANSFRLHPPTIDQSDY